MLRCFGLHNEVRRHFCVDACMMQPCCIVHYPRCTVTDTLWSSLPSGTMPCQLTAVSWIGTRDASDNKEAQKSHPKVSVRSDCYSQRMHSTEELRVSGGTGCHCEEPRLPVLQNC